MRCPSCRIDLPVSDGPVHEFMLTSPPCWALYQQILTREFADSRLSHLHRLTVDTYCAQHPGKDLPTPRRSMAVHLSRLYLLIERHWQVESAMEAARTIDRLDLRAPWLTPPSMAGTFTVKDVISATTLEEHESSVQAWAESVWRAWHPHHKTIRSWCLRLQPSPCSKTAPSSPLHV